MVMWAGVPGMPERANGAVPVRSREFDPHLVEPIDESSA
jgi:hypothetical protein